MSKKLQDDNFNPLASLYDGRVIGSDIPEE
jgi:hypothetical protein